MFILKSDWHKHTNNGIMWQLTCLLNNVQHKHTYNNLTWQLTHILNRVTQTYLKWPYMTAHMCSKHFTPQAYI